MTKEIKEVDAVIAENSDEAFWLENKDKAIEAIASMKRNIKVNEKILELCEEQLKLFG